MANTVIAVRSSSATGNQPSLGVIANGELSLNFADGILYYKTSSNTLGQIRTTQVSGSNQQVQFNDSGSFGSNTKFTFDKNTGILSAPIVNVSTSYLQFADGTKQYTANAGSSTITSVGGQTGAISNTQLVSFVTTPTLPTTGNIIVYNGTSFTSLANTGTAGTYGNSTYVPVITTDAYGRVTSVVNTAISVSGGTNSNGILLNNTSIGLTQTVSTSYNGLSVGPMTLLSGVSVTVASGQRWYIL